MRTLLIPLLLPFALLSLVASPARAAYAPYDPSMPAHAEYIIDALHLHPTQFCLGFREVTFKAGLLDRMSPAQATAFMKKKNVPVVIGPGGVPYLADGHHTVRALLESTQPDKRVYGHILANWSRLPLGEFWQRMVEHHYAYLKGSEGRGPVDPAKLPANLLGMQSDPYRSLAWGVLAHHGYREVKGPSGFFQEFHWGDYFRDKVRWNDNDTASFERAVVEAVALAHDPAARALPGYIPGSDSAE